jgi:hypothetical protein
MNIFLLATKKNLLTLKLIYHSKLEHLHLEVPYLWRFLCCLDDGLSSTLVKKVSQWQRDDCVFAPNSKRSMLLQLFVTNFLHVCQACHLFLSIVCCVHLLSIVWCCSWVLQRLQISIFSLQYCHEKTFQHGSYSSFLFGLLPFVIFDSLV